MSDSLFSVLPYEINLQIALQLPQKSILNCKLVCKLWYGMVSDREFVKIYNQNARDPRLLILRFQTLDQWTVPLRFSFATFDKNSGPSEMDLTFVGQPVKIEASCNNLLLCVLASPHIYFVCNPITREFRRLPGNFFLFNEGEIEFVGLACEISSPTYRVALAYHGSFRSGNYWNFRCLIYDSVTDKWRRFDTHVETNLYVLGNKKVVYVNGRLHWLVRNLSFILVLDLDNDSWVRVSLPIEIPPESGDHAYLVDYDEFLSIFHISNMQADIWVLKDYTAKTWEKVDSVNLTISLMIPTSHNNCYTYWINGEWTVRGYQGQIIGYDHKVRAWNVRYDGNGFANMRGCFTFQNGYGSLLI